MVTCRARVTFYTLVVNGDWPALLPLAGVFFVVFCYFFRFGRDCFLNGGGLPVYTWSSGSSRERDECISLLCCVSVV